MFDDRNPNTIIGITGRAGAGKDTFARLLQDAIPRGPKIGSPPASILPLAAPLKEIVKQVFGFSQRQLYGPSEERNKPDPYWTRDDGRPPVTPREALQTLGTEWGRALHTDVWIRHVLRDHDARDTISIIPDVRFANEARAIRERGGIVIWIERPTDDAKLTGAAAAHASEAGVDDALVDAVIVNDGGLDALTTLAEYVAAHVDEIRSERAASRSPVLLRRITSEDIARVRAQLGSAR